MSPSAPAAADPRPARTLRQEHPILSTELSQLLEELSGYLEDEVDLAGRFETIVAGWRAAVPGCTSVAIVLRPDHRDGPLVLVDRPVDGSAPAVVSSLSVPLGWSGGSDAVLRLDASTPRTFDRALAELGPLLAADGRVARLDHGAPAALAVLLAAEAVRNQAIGVLLHQHGGSVAAAGIRLDALAATAGRSTSDVAAELVAATRRTEPDLPPAAATRRTEPDRPPAAAAG
jgi:hypothetical protein